MRRLACIFVLLLAAAQPDAPGDQEWVRVEDKGKASLWIRKHQGKPLEIKLSEVLTLAMRVEGQPPLTVEFSEKVRSNEGWHLERVGPPTTTVDPATKQAQWEQTFKATPLQPGVQPLPLPAVQFTEHDDTPHDVAWTPLALVVTTRVAKVDISEARDLAPIEELPLPAAAPTPWWPWLVAAIAVLALGAWLVFGRRSRAPAGPTPRDVALKQLDELAALPVATAAEMERMHTKLSDVLRRYLERRFDLPAPRRTTVEFLAALAHDGPLAAGQRQLLGNILERCDLAKFAGVGCTVEECQGVVGMARQFVRDLEPASEKT